MSARRLEEACVACGQVGLDFRFVLEGERIFACAACRTHHVRPLPDAMRLHECYDGGYALVGQVGEWIARRGVAEELWTVARRGEAPQ